MRLKRAMLMLHLQCGNRQCNTPFVAAVNKHKSRLDGLCYPDCPKCGSRLHSAGNPGVFVRINPVVTGYEYV